MTRLIEGQDRNQVTLLPECLDDFVADGNPVRVVEAFIDELDMVAMSFEGAISATTARPSYHPAFMLKVYLYIHSVVRTVNLNPGVWQLLETQ